MFSVTLCLVTLVAVSKCYPELLLVSVNTEELENISGDLTGVNEGPLDFESKVGSIPQSHWPPDAWDWREFGGVIPIVKNQGDCDAGWAFSITAAIESHRQIHLNIAEFLSEQFLIDCIVGSTESTHGCSNKYSPHLQKETYGEIIAKFNGVLRDRSYREYSANKSTCAYPEPEPGPVTLPAEVSGFRSLYTDYFEQDMIYDLITKGPLVAAINSASMKNYTGGIDEPTEYECDPGHSSMDHFVLIVGYRWTFQNDHMLPYWIIKNSWGEDWGESGYYHLVRGRNACGIANDITIPFVDNLGSHFP